MVISKEGTRAGGPAIGGLRGRSLAVGRAVEPVRLGADAGWACPAAADHHDAPDGAAWRRTLDPSGSTVTGSCSMSVLVRSSRSIRSRSAFPLTVTGLRMTAHRRYAGNGAAAIAR